MSSTSTITEQRLYGLPGAERLHFDPADVVQEWLDDRCDDGAEPRFVIEEFSVRPARDHLPTPERVLEWIEEWSNEHGEWSDDPDLSIGGDEALAATDALLDVLATQITFRMADEHLRDLHVTPSDDPDNPLLDGEPTWSAGMTEHDAT